MQITTNTQEIQICKGFKLANPKFYVPIDLVKLVAEFALKPPKEYNYMEKYTIFISKHSWQDILAISAEQLAQLGCECKTENFSLFCMFYNEQHSVAMPFRVNIFTSSDSEDEYVVEFQRRCSRYTLEFLELFARFIQQDKGCGMVNRGRIEGSSFPQPRSIQIDSFGPVILDKDALDCLLCHLKSEYLDVQAEGLFQLAKCVQTKENCVLMRRVPLFVSLLCSFLDTDYSYPTLVILKFLLNPSFKSLMIKEHENLLSQLDVPKMKFLLGKDLGGKTYENLIQTILTYKNEFTTKFYPPK